MKGTVHRIAVIADTHGRFPEKLIKELNEADEIWHLGDFCNLETLSLCQSIGRPFLAVLGNNDHGLALPETLDLERGGRRCRLVHIPPRRVPDCDVLIHGHTHVPRDESVDGCRILNPGTVGKPDKGAPASWAWLEIDSAGRIDWKIVLI